MNTQWFVTYAIMGVLCQAVPAIVQEAIADPGASSGPASGMRVLHGEVKQAGLKTIVIDDGKGKEVTMSIDAATAGDRDIRPGDVITGTVTAQGRAVAIHKDAGAKADKDISMSGAGQDGDIMPRQGK
ncbi:MAG TPA: hypothetical protein VF127_03345 [Nitrospira sp.]